MKTAEFILFVLIMRNCDFLKEACVVRHLREVKKKNMYNVECMNSIDIIIHTNIIVQFNMIYINQQLYVMFYHQLLNIQQIRLFELAKHHQHQILLNYSQIDY